MSSASQYIADVLKSKGVANFLPWTERLGGCFVALVGIYLARNAF